MTSKWTTSAPAAMTASTSAPRRAKSAERIEGAIQCMRISLAHAPAGANRLVGGLNLLRALLGAFEHRLRQAVGLELVGVMAAHLPAIRFHDLLVGHDRCGFEHAVGLRQALFAARKAAAEAAASIVAPRAAWARSGGRLTPAQNALEPR